MSFELGLLLKSTLILTAAGLVAVMLSRASASIRHALWLVSLAGLLLLPAVGLFSPGIEFAILSGGISETGGVVLQDESRSTLPGAPDSATPETEAVLSEPSTSAYASAHDDEHDAGVVPDRWASGAWLPAAWVLGALLVWFPFLHGALRVRRLSRGARPAGADIQELLSELRSLMNIDSRRRIEIRIAEAPMSPMTWGLVRHTILLPFSAGDWDPETQRAVLAHELAHIVRRDALAQPIVRLVSSLYWFHPLAWFAVRRLQMERERACDDRVIGLGTNPEDYADHLLRVTRQIGLRVSASATAMAQPSHLEKRLRSILDPGIRRLAVSRAAGMGMVCAIGGLTIALGSVSLVAGEPNVRETPTPSVELLSEASPEESSSVGVGAPAASSLEPKTQLSPLLVSETATPAQDAGSVAPRRIRSNDVVRIHVYGEPDLSGIVRIQPDGRLSSPLIQDLPAEGLTLARLADAITARLEGFIQQPRVTVVLESAEPYTFYVTGNVQRPGVFTSETPPTVLQALAIAGGFSQFANRNAVTIVRSEPGSEDTIFLFDYDTAIAGESPGQNIRLEPEDLVVVP